MRGPRGWRRDRVMLLANTLAAASLAVLASEVLFVLFAR